MSISLISVTRWVLLAPLAMSLSLDAPSVPQPLPTPSLRFNAVHRLLRAASRAGVEGLSNLDDSSSRSGESESEMCDDGAVCLSPDDGVHGPCLVLKRDLPEHEYVLKVPWGCLVSGSSWAEDSSLGRALAHEGILHTAALLGGDSHRSTGDGRSSEEAILVTEGTEFQGSEPLLVLWLLLQNRWAPCDDCDDANGTNDSERAARHAYFEALDGAEVADSIAAQCAFAWSEADIVRLLAPSPTATRALAARAEMRAAYNTLKALLARTNVWQTYLDTATGSDENPSQARDVTWGEFVWAYATVASRAVRFSSSRSDRSTWSGLYLEMVGDLLNHAPPRQPSSQLMNSGNTVKEAFEDGELNLVDEGAVPKDACAFRFLNEGEGYIQYHIEDGGVASGAELLYTYGTLTPGDALLFYGFALRTEDTSSSSNINHKKSARQIWRCELLCQLGLPLKEDIYAPGSAASIQLASILAEYDTALEKLQADLVISLEEGSSARPDHRLNDCLQVLRAERNCLAN